MNTTEVRFQLSPMRPFNGIAKCRFVFCFRGEDVDRVGCVSKVSQGEWVATCRRKGGGHMRVGDSFRSAQRAGIAAMKEWIAQGCPRVP